MKKRIFTCSFYLHLRCNVFPSSTSRTLLEDFCDQPAARANPRVFRTLANPSPGGSSGESEWPVKFLGFFAIYRKSLFTIATWVVFLDYPGICFSAGQDIAKSPTAVIAMPTPTTGRPREALKGCEVCSPSCRAPSPSPQLLQPLDSGISRLRCLLRYIRHFRPFSVAAALPLARRNFPHPNNSLDPRLLTIPNNCVRAPYRALVATSRFRVTVVPCGVKSGRGWQRHGLDTIEILEAQISRGSARES